MGNLHEIEKARTKAYRTAELTEMRTLSTDVINFLKDDDGVGTIEQGDKALS